MAKVVKAVKKVVKKAVKKKTKKEVKSTFECLNCEDSGKTCVYCGKDLEVTNIV